ncbi:hypothetical protein D3C73_1029710 [compost metagenome]
MHAHRQALGDGVGLVDPAGARAADIQLLQADDVGFMLGDDVGDPLHIQSAIDADAAMNVVGQKSRHEFLARDRSDCRASMRRSRGPDNRTR